MILYENVYFTESKMSCDNERHIHFLVSLRLTPLHVARQASSGEYLLMQLNKILRLSNLTSLEKESADIFTAHAARYMERTPKSSA